MDRLVGEDFNALFETFERTAFRLETREHYTVDEEADALQEFLADGRFDLGWFEPWLQTIRTITAAGRTISRVRVVNEPPTDYQRFELAVAPANISAGETITLLERSKARTLNLPEYDFWIFDDNRLVTMHFADDGRMVEALATEDQDVVRQHREAQARATAHATPYADYIAHHPLRPATEA
jgi:hypothetical protein